MVVHDLRDKLIQLREWKNKTFEECVLDFNDQECHITNGSMRDYAIVRYGNIHNAQKYQSTAQLLFSLTSVARISSAQDTTRAGP